MHGPAVSGGLAFATNQNTHSPLPSRGRDKHACVTGVIATPGVNRNGCCPYGRVASGGVVEQSRLHF